MLVIATVSLAERCRRCRRSRSPCSTRTQRPASRRHVVGDRDRLRVARVQIRQRAGDRLAFESPSGQVKLPAATESTTSRESTVSVRLMLSACETPVFFTVDREGVTARAGVHVVVREVLVTTRFTSSVIATEVVLGVAVFSSEDAFAVFGTRVGLRRRRHVEVDGDRLRRARGQVAERAVDDWLGRAGVVARDDRVHDQPRVDRVGQVTLSASESPSWSRRS